ncbi:MULTISPECIES: hypothetical protein [Exiguobacterium]|uniref:hypothetical protein n=1 Tax=Exiguobacterium sp. UBA1053 TaxID=1946487 RepID=UPI0025C16E3F|nr:MULTISPECIES: hypothetical protein [Exiguobacterium]
MYKPAAELLLHESVSLFDRIGEDLLLFRDRHGFMKCDADLRPLWETACAYVPFSWYIEPGGGRLFIVFEESAYFGLLDLEQGHLEYIKRPAAFSEAWFSNLFLWQDDEIFLYTAETDVVCVNVQTGDWRYSNYEEAPLFGRLIERGYDTRLTFERFIAPTTIISYDDLKERYVIWDAATNQESIIPFSDYAEYSLVDHRHQLFSITDSSRFYLYEKSQLKYKFEGCHSSVLLKSVLLDEEARRLAIVSTSATFGNTWVQIFQKT